MVSTDPSGPSDTKSNRAKHNHTFTNQMTFSLKSMDDAQDSKRKQPIPGKDYWPELVGMDGSAAKKVIQREGGPKIKIELVPRGSYISEDVRQNRVRIFIHADTNRVAVAPRIA